MPHTELEFYFIFGLLSTLLSAASISLDTGQVFTPVLGFSPCLPFPPAPSFSERWPQANLLVRSFFQRGFVRGWSLSSHNTAEAMTPSCSFILLFLLFLHLGMDFTGFTQIHFFPPKSHILSPSAAPTQAGHWM